jgi:NADH dehydrogenase FAD-containing subunit
VTVPPTGTNYHQSAGAPRSTRGAQAIILLDAGERVTAAFTAKLSSKVGRYLGELGAQNQLIDGDLASIEHPPQRA